MTNEVEEEPPKVSKVKGIDAIFDEAHGGVRTNACYPIFLGLLVFIICWPCSSMAFFITNIIVVYPDYIQCNGLDVELAQCVNMTSSGQCDDLSVQFEGNWTKETLITHYDLVCHVNSFLQDVNCITVIGCVFGSLIFGNISDIFGRRVTMLICCVIAGVAGFIGTFVGPYSKAAFLAAKFFTAFTSQGAALIATVYVVEIATPGNRAKFAVMPNMFYAIGYMLLSLWGYAFDHWQWMMLITACWPLLFIIAFPFIPESYRWHFSKGRFERGKDAIRSYADHCGVSISKATMDKLVADEPHGTKVRERRVSHSKSKSKRSSISNYSRFEMKEHVYTIADLFKTYEIRWLTLKMCYLYFTRFAVYYAVFMIDLQGERLLVNFLFGLIEFCSPIISLPIINLRYSNRPIWCTVCFALLVFIFALGGGVAEISYLNPENDNYRKGVLALQLIGAIPAIIVSSYLWAWATELYPTPIRNSAVGLFVCIGKLAGIVTSQIYRLNKPPHNIFWLPNLIIAIFALIAAFLSYGIRDTNQLPLVQSIDDAEKMLAKNNINIFTTLQRNAAKKRNAAQSSKE